MTNHPNRGAAQTAAANPSPESILQAREAAGLSQSEAGDESDTGEMSVGDEPWSEFGGNAIIAASGLPEFDDSGCDSYRDQYGDDVVTQWVQWNIETE